MTLAHDPAVAQRAVQPAPQQAPAHRSDGAVQHTQQRVPGVAVDAGVEFEMAPGRRIHRDRAVAGFDPDRGEVRQALLLGFLDITEQCTGGGDRKRFAVDAEAGEIEQIEELQQLPASAVGIEQPRCAAAHAVPGGQRCRPAVFIGYQQFGRIQPRKFGFQHVVAGDFIDQETPAGKIRPSDAVSLFAAGYRHQQGVAAILQQGFIGDRARRDDAHHLAFDQAFRQRRVADLFADRDRFAQCDQAREITLVRMRRHARHRNGLAGGTAALRQGDVEQTRGLARIVVKQLVKIAHPEKKQHIRMLRLGREKLAHQRGVLVAGGAGCRNGGRCGNGGIGHGRTAVGPRCARGQRRAGRPVCQRPSSLRLVMLTLFESCANVRTRLSIAR